VKGRERGGDADARRDFLDMRGFRQDEHAWRMRFIDRGPRVERDFDLFLKTFGEQSEFCRRDVLSTWPGTDNDGRAHTQEKPTSTVPGSKIPGNTTGPRPEKRKAIIERMISDYANAPEKLENEKQEVLATKYGAARSTVQKARPDALEYLRRNSDK